MKKIVTAILIGLLLIVTFNPSTSEVKATANDWWDPAWEYRKEITIDHDMVDADLSNFPILFHNTSSDFTDHAQSDGDDFAFVNYDNTLQYKHEIEYYNSTTGKLVAWINITNLNSSSDTALWLYFGNPDCGNNQDRELVWDFSYKGVWHMNDNTFSRIIDSTNNRNDGLKIGANEPKEIIGKIAKAQDFDGNNDFIYCRDNESLNITDELTIEMWIKPRTIFNQEFHRRLLVRRIPAWYLYQCNDSIYLQVGLINEEFPQVWTYNVLNVDTWFYVVATYCRTTCEIEIYVNGERKINHSVADIDLRYPTSHLQIGNSDELTEPFNGTLDEIRISNLVRNNNWIKTTYRNTNNPSTFLNVGSEQWYYDDHIPPTVEITQPELGFLYVNLLEYPFKIPVLLPFATIIVGKIEVAVNASDNVGVEWVKFYIDDVLQATKKDPPYNWTWNKQTVIFPYTLKVCACDPSGNEKWAEIKVWRMQLFQYT